MIKKKNISQEDIDTWKNYIKNPTDITDKDQIQKASQSRPNRFKFDLHGFTLSLPMRKLKKLFFYLERIIKKFYLSLEKVFILIQKKTLMFLMN